MKIQIPLGTGSYDSTSRQFSAQRCVNMYSVVARAKALNGTALFGTPGIKSFSNVGLNKSRGTITMDGVYYIVSGNNLYSIDKFGVTTNHGIVSGGKRVSMADNGEKLCIVVPGGDAYEYNSTTTILTKITDPDFRTADTVCFKDGYYVFSASAGDVFFNSALNNPLSFDALDFGTAELSPDRIVACHASYDEVYVLGSETTEVFQNIGGAGFPFQRIPGASYEKGTHSKYSAIQWEGSFYFAGGGKNEKTSIFRSSGGGEPLRISTDAIDAEIQKFNSDEIAESSSFTYSVEGISFVGFIFRSILIPSRTFVYNVTSSELIGSPVWIEQQTGIIDNAWRVESVDFAYSKLLVSDVIDGRIGELDINTHTEYGDAIVREKTTGPLSSNGKSIIVNSMELTVDSGVGTISGQGEDPKVMMSYSDDGARTWSSEIWRELGKIGEYIRRSAWRRLGRIPAHRVWKFRVTDPVKVVFIKLEAEVKGGS